MGGVAAGVADIFGVAAGGFTGAAFTLGTAGEVAAGIAAGTMTAAEAISAGYTAADLVAAGVSTADIVSSGAGVGEMLSAGIAPEQLAQAGITAQQLSAAGATAEQLTAATPYFEAAAQGAGSTPFQLADGSMGSIQGGNILDSAGNIVAKGGVGTTLGDLAGYAKTGAQLIGGIGQLGQAANLLGGGGKTKPGVADPYAQYRPQNAAQLQNLLANPSTITSTPEYQFNLAEGLKAQSAKQAAQGRLVSGGALLEANQFGQNYATSSLSQQEALLAQLSGATQAPAGAAQAQQGINFGQTGQLNYGLQTLASGVQGVANPLQTLYSQYNQSSPSVT
jgi:hypothetical protein